MRVPDIAQTPRRLRHRLTVPGALCLVVLAAALPAQASSDTPTRATAAVADYTLQLDTGSAPELAGKRIGIFLQAVRAFGHPELVVPAAPTPPTCTASWPRLSLEIDFSSARPGTCGAKDLGRWLAVSASAPRWHTHAGLHVGDTERRLHSLYPKARRLDFLGMGRMWELETGGPLCDGGPPLALAGRVRAGRISALTVVHVPACG
jgi:hypothetical protein